MEQIDNVHTGLCEIDAVSGNDYQTMDKRGCRNQAIFDRHGFPDFTKLASNSAHFRPVSHPMGGSEDVLRRQHNLALGRHRSLHKR